jgi:hypothetical protein
MASESIRELILQHCETSLAAVNGVGSYQLDLETVSRGQGAPSNLDVLPAARIAEGTESVTNGPDPLITRTLPITVTGWVRVSDDSLVSLATLRNRMQQDIETALLTDWTRGGLAVNTRLTGSRTPDDDEPDVLGSVEVSFELLYRTRHNNPTVTL